VRPIRRKRIGRLFRARQNTSNTRALHIKPVAVSIIALLPTVVAERRARSLKRFEDERRARTVSSLLRMLG
jgi:hypothetical protein